MRLQKTDEEVLGGEEEEGLWKQPRFSEGGEESKGGVGWGAAAPLGGLPSLDLPPIPVGSAGGPLQGDDLLWAPGGGWHEGTAHSRQGCRSEQLTCGRR